MPGRPGLTFGEVISSGAVRDLALALPGSFEAAHWGNPSFRVGGKIYATVPDPRHLNVMIDPFDVEAAVRENPQALAALPWGKQIAGVQVTLAKAPPKLVADLLVSAWRRRAPRRLLSSPSGQAAPPPRRPRKRRPKG
jgi:hypothetical protein